MKLLSCLLVLLILWPSIIFADSSSPVSDEYEAFRTRVGHVTIGEYETIGSLECRNLLYCYDLTFSATHLRGTSKRAKSLKILTITARQISADDSSGLDKDESPYKTVLIAYEELNGLMNAVDEIMSYANQLRRPEAIAQAEYRTQDGLEIGYSQRYVTHKIFLNFPELPFPVEVTREFLSSLKSLIKKAKVHFDVVAARLP